MIYFSGSVSDTSSLTSCPCETVLERQCLNVLCLHFFLLLLWFKDILSWKPAVNTAETQETLDFSWVPPHPSSPLTRPPPRFSSFSVFIHNLTVLWLNHFCLNLRVCVCVCLSLSLRSFLYLQHQRTDWENQHFYLVLMKKSRSKERRYEDVCEEMNGRKDFGEMGQWGWTDGRGGLYWGEPISTAAAAQREKGGDTGEAKWLKKASALSWRSEIWTMWPILTSIVALNADCGGLCPWCWRKYL